EQKTAAEQGAISGKYLFSSGDIIYSKIRPYLRKAVLPTFEGLCSADMYPLTPAEDVSSEFIFAILLGRRFSQFADTVSARSGIPKINREELGDFCVALPFLTEQRAIATVLSDMDGEIAALEARRAKTQAIKQGMMQQLLTGKVRLLDGGIDN
ncbi:MAG: restriction endonuclease subunit S, partial [Cyanobacteria bacterium P01_F01_bin.86]